MPDLKELEEYLCHRIKPEILRWSEEDISDAYAVSFYVYSNECYVYRGKSNLTEFSVGYVTERDCGNAPELSDDRWYFPALIDNISIFQPNNVAYASPEYRDEGMEFLFDWYSRNGIDNVGFEDPNGKNYDFRSRYIGKGPNGFWEVWTAAANVARHLQEEGVVRKVFGAALPIIVHQMEVYDEVRDRIAYANPNGEADAFLAYYDNMIDGCRE